MVISCRRPEDGGSGPAPEEQRQMLLRTAIAEGVEYIDLEEDIAGGIPASARRSGSSACTISARRRTTWRRSTGGWPARPGHHQDLHDGQPPARQRADSGVARRSPIPTIGLGMGDIGVPTRILAGRAGAPFTYATFHHERVLAPGQLSFQQMTEVYHYDRIDAQTEVYGVVADPVGHSLSPLMHNAAFAHLGLNKVYVPFRVPREDLARFIDDAPALGLRGLSVTIPHKEEIIQLLTEADGAVRGIGAANTVVFDGQNRLRLQHRLPRRHEQPGGGDGGAPAEGREVAAKAARPWCSGAGGVGMAMAHGLVRRGAQVVVADGLARKAGAGQTARLPRVEWSLRHGVSADILVNCTPVGMHPNVDESPFDKHYLKPSMVVFDVVYNPESTLLVKEARSRNCTVVTGVEMFVRQACMQFKLFTGQEGPAELMRDVFRRAIGAAKT